MRYIKIKLDVSDENYIFLHRALKQFLDERTSETASFYKINSWRFVNDG